MCPLCYVVVSLARTEPALLTQIALSWLVQCRRLARPDVQVHPFTVCGGEREKRGVKRAIYVLATGKSPAGGHGGHYQCGWVGGGSIQPTTHLSPLAHCLCSSWLSHLILSFFWFVRRPLRQGVLSAEHKWTAELTHRHSLARGRAIFFRAGFWTALFPSPPKSRLAITHLLVLSQLVLLLLVLTIRLVSCADGDPYCCIAPLRRSPCFLHRKAQAEFRCYPPKRAALCEKQRLYSQWPSIACALYHGSSDISSYAIFSLHARCSPEKPMSHIARHSKTDPRVPPSSTD